MSQQRDLRRHRRELLDGKVRLSWQDDSGLPRYAIGRCINVSEAGLQVELTEPVAARTYLSFRIEKGGLQGSGSVRYCRRVSTKFHAGLEFTGGLRWCIPVDRESQGADESLPQGA